MTKLTLLGPAGRNRHHQAIVRVKCSCGSPEFTCRKDSFESGNTTSCGCSRPGGRKIKVPTPQPAPKASTAPAVPPTLTPVEHERGTPAWYVEQIAGKEAAAIAAEKRANDLEAQIAGADATDLDVHKKWNTEATTARKLRQEIDRLMGAKDKAETAVVKDARSQAEITRDRIRALKGEK